MINKEKRVLDSILNNFVLSAEEEKKAKEILASAMSNNSKFSGVKANIDDIYNTPVVTENKSMIETFVDCHNFNLIKDFVDQQDFYSINNNGKIERNVLVNDFQKYCYENNLKHTLKRDEIIEMVKDEYYLRSESKLSKQEFFDSLKPQSFKYRW